MNALQMGGARLLMAYLEREGIRVIDVDGSKRNAGSLLPAFNRDYVERYPGSAEDDRNPSPPGGMRC